MNHITIASPWTLNKFQNFEDLHCQSQLIVQTSTNDSLIVISCAIGLEVSIFSSIQFIGILFSVCWISLEFFLKTSHDRWVNQFIRDIIICLEFVIEPEIFLIQFEFIIKIILDSKRFLIKLINSKPRSPCSEGWQTACQHTERSNFFWGFWISVNNELIRMGMAIKLSQNFMFVFVKHSSKDKLVSLGAWTRR